MPDRMSVEEIEREVKRISELNSTKKHGHKDSAVRHVDNLLQIIHQLLEERSWQPIETAPKDGRRVLCGFQGQFRWLEFVGECNPHGVGAPGYAKPTHWMPLPTPPKDAARKGEEL